MSDVYNAGVIPATETTLPPGEPAPAEPTNYEDRARRMGWRPKEEFRGDPNRWTDAKTFVERGENELPVLRENFRRMDEKFARTTEELSDVKTKLVDQSKVLSEFVDFSRKAEERSYNRARSELEAKMSAAVEVADTAAFKAAKAELDNLEQAKPPAAPTKVETPAVVPQAQIDPAVHEWIGQNDWYNRDPVLQQFATAFHVQLLKTQPGLAMRDNLAEVKREVISRFPEKFGNPKREGAPAVGTPSGGVISGGGKKKKGFDDLPGEAKAACDKYVRLINAANPKTPYTREEYVKMYFAGEE